MDRPHLPLNALRAFEAAARQGSFTRAAIELSVTLAAVSHHIKGLEARLGLTLFRRTSRGLVLTDEGSALVPVLEAAFDKMGEVLDRFRDGRYQEVLHLGVVTTFAAGWLIERLPRFAALHPGIDLRISTNNNRVDIAGEGLGMAIRFGDGAWRGEVCTRLFQAPMSPLCRLDVAARLGGPADLAKESLFRSFRADEWQRWFAAQSIPCPDIRGPVLDSSLAIAGLAAAGFGIGMLPLRMFAREISEGRLVRPFETKIATGSYWLTRLKSRDKTPAMKIVEDWLVDEVEREDTAAIC
ncbi:MAG: LysR family transcriptional regulator [Pararhodobacter sp.]|nr:LysR family transcriptional regulator [Pararhodobacter sp.]